MKPEYEKAIPPKYETRDERKAEGKGDEGKEKDQGTQGRDIR